MGNSRFEAKIGPDETGDYLYVDHNTDGLPGDEYPVYINITETHWDSASASVGLTVAQAKKLIAALKRIIDSEEA